MKHIKEHGLIEHYTNNTTTVIKTSSLYIEPNLDFNYPI